MDDKRSTPLEDNTPATVEEQGIKLEIGSPKRQPDEDFEEYKKRRARENASIKRWLKGRPSIGHREK